MNKAWRMLAANKTAEVSIEGVIGDGWEDGVTAKNFISDLKALGELETINMRIYSPGGSVMEGNAIFNALLSHPAKVVAQVDFAASMATIIAMAADEIVMAENGFFMIHNPWSVALGDSNDMRKTADLLDKIKDQAVKAYKRHAKLSEEEIAGMMDEETWMTADEALDFGFIHAKSHAITVAAAIQTDMLKNVPDAAMKFITPPAAAEPDTVEMFAADQVAAMVSAKAEAAYQEGYDAAVAKVTADHEAKVAEMVASAVAAVESRFAGMVEELADAMQAAEEATSEVDALKMKIESMTAGFEYQPETRGAFNGTKNHPYFQRLAELKESGLTDDQARKKLDEDEPHLRQSLIAAANTKR